MFDIGFWELGLITVVALVVIGPERLPGVARTVGKWVGSMQRFVSSVKSDIDSEINKHEDLKQLIDEQKELKETHEILEKTVSDLSEASSIPSSSSDVINNTLGSDLEPETHAAGITSNSEGSKPDTGESGAKDKPPHV